MQNALCLYPERPTVTKNEMELELNNENTASIKNKSEIDNNLNCNFVAHKTSLDKNTIVLSSASENDSIECNSKNKTIKKKINKKKLKVIETPKRKSKKINFKEKPSTKRKLTKSTNLKTFASKDHPENQAKLEEYFMVTPYQNSIKYFDTFIKSSKQDIHLNLSESPLLQNQLSNSYLTVSENISKHFSSKKKTIYISENVNKFEKNPLRASRSKLLRNRNPMDCVSGNESELNSNESVHFFYNSIPSIKTESNIYSLPEDTVVHQSCRLNSKNSITTTSNSEKIVYLDQFQITKAQENIVRKRLSFESATITCCESKDHDLISFNNTIAKHNSSSLLQNSTSSNLLFGIEQYKYNSYDCPIIIDDEDFSSNSNISKSRSKLKSHVNKTNSTKKPSSKTVRKKYLNTRCNRVLRCPSYKVIEGTTFAVDGFRFGAIDGVTHYFLTHFHADHYIGLKKSFDMPIYMSKITATLVSKFINVSSEFLHIIDANETKIINGVEVTSIDANHCPGAVMFAFKLSSGKCVLHTGDFRASPEMESESYFWNNSIDTIYLDTTYLHKNYDFKQQSESIDDVRFCIENFREKHIGQKILFVCGSYIIGKEKVWSEIAKITGHKVYTDGNRRKALQAIGNRKLLKHLIDDPRKANIHILTMSEVNYLKLYEYFKLFNDNFDVILGIRPSGWEKNTKPRFSGIINVIGIEYSEHSSYSELRRFCRYLQPKSIISTVPTNNNDLSTTAKIPKNWFNSKTKPRQQGYQPTISSYISSTSKKQSNNDQEPCCSKFLNQNDYCSDTGMLDATKSSTAFTCQDNIQRFIRTKENTERSSELSDDWMS